jgi:exosortase
MALCAVLISGAGVYLAGGSTWLRHFAFPLLFFLVAVPWPTNLEQIVIQGLMRIDALINVELLTALGIPAVQLGNVIEVGSGFVGIDEACTGIRSLQATFMVSLFLGEFYEFSVLRRVILVVAAAFLAFFCNLVRTFLLVYLGAEHGFQAIKTWHDPAGYTILTVCLLGLWGLSLILSRKDPPRARAARPRTGFQIPRLALVMLLGLTVVAEAGTQTWYRVHEARTAHLPPWTVTWPTRATNWKEVPIEEGAQGILRYNEGGGGDWFADGHNWSMFFFKWLPGRTAGLFIKNHRPDICLPASGMIQRGGVQNKLLTVNGVPLPMRSYVFENAGRPLHVFYCYWDGTPPKPEMVNQENWTASGRLEAVKRGKRDVGTQMLEIVAWGYDDPAKAEAAALEQLRQIIKPG